MEAVILAAGIGSRLRNILSERPKGFLELNQTPIIERSIRQIKHAGIGRIIIVTGYQSTWYAQLAGRIKGLELIHNDLFETSGSLYSFAAARPLVRGNFLLLESDLVYDSRALSALLSVDQPNVLLLSGQTKSGDEVYVETQGERFVQMSKRRESLKSVGGELVGISKISLPLYQKILAFADTAFQTSLKIEYEESLNALAAGEKIGFHKIDDLVWSEIDDESHLARVKAEILPRLMVSDGMRT